jgi:hypothetical protein
MERELVGPLIWKRFLLGLRDRLYGWMIILSRITDYGLSWTVRSRKKGSLSDFV